VSSNQNNKTGEPATNDVAANEQNTLSPITPPPLETSPPQTEPPMEVHHHAHTARKKWTHYFWEFFMLFLAVFCGFLAENQREHYIEHQREQQFMKSMAEDLVRDKAMLTVSERRAMSVSNYIDTVVNILQSQKFDDGSVYTLYRVNLNSLSFFGTRYTDRTSIQLKNSGAMRLIRKEIVTDGIIDYWGQIDDLERTNELIDEYKMKARDQSYSIFYARYYSDISGITTVNEARPRLITTNLLQLSEYANRLSHIKSLIANRYIPQVKVQQESARKLISLIKKEYSLQ
jgi:hypothetical protein